MLMESMSVNHITSSPHYPQSKWIHREICRDHQKSVLQSQGGRPIPLHSPNGLQKTHPQWKCTVTHANSIR